jgi:hypothetical protein
VSPPLPVPRYGEAALADLLPSVLSALGVDGEPNPLGVAAVQRAVVLLVDGLGWEGLRANPTAAPFLASLPGRPLTAGFPATTVTSLSSLGTGLPPGEHGMTGYSSYVEEVGTAVNWLAWRAIGSADDLRDRLVPEVVQPRQTAFERAEAAGISVSTVIPGQFDGSGLTRAALRGGRFTGSIATGDVAARAADAADRGHRSLVYAYTSELDLIGHVRGPASDAWLVQLSLVDALAAQLAARLPSGSALFVTADHGMVEVPDEGKVDADEDAELAEGVVALAGEPRARYVHTRPGAAGDVLATWRARLGGGMWVLSRDEAIAAGLFGPAVTADARARIGDVIALAHAPVGVVQRRRERTLSSLLGQHGSLTDAELLVPLLEARVD